MSLSAKKKKTLSYLSLSLSLPTKKTTRPKKQTKIVDELFAYWTLGNSEDALEELEEALIVSGSFSFVVLFLFLEERWSY